MNFNDNFDLKKAKSFLLTENFQMDETENLEEMASFYSIKPDVDEDEAKEAIAAIRSKVGSNTAFAQTLDSLLNTGEADYKAFQLATKDPETGKMKDIATWNKPETRAILQNDGPLSQYLNASSSPGANRSGRPKVKKDEEKLDENETLSEMATFYKIKPDVDEDEAKEAIAAIKAKIRPGTEFYKTLDSLEKTGEADYIEFKKATISPENPQGKDAATWNNPKTRAILQNDGPLAQFLSAGSSPSINRSGRPKSEKGKETAAPVVSKTDTIKITTPKTSTPTEKAPVKAASTERDLAKEIKDAEAEVKKLGLAALKSQDPKDMAKAKEATAKLKALNKEAGR
jgi:uncharacterized protein (DUF2267 family)